MQKKSIIIVIAVILISPPFLLFVAYIFGILRCFDFSSKDKFLRSYRNFTGSYERQTTIEHYAGCQIRTMVDQMSDENFTKFWTRDSQKLNFDAKDVDKYMMTRCAPESSDEDVEKAHRRYQKSYEESSGKKIDESEMIRSIERDKSMNRYQYKFLNREFSVFKNQN